MARDFRASQIQTTQIISSGSNNTGARIVFYDISGQSSVSPNQGIIDPDKFGTGSIGDDIFVYVSGGINERGTSNNSIAVFGGDVHISGNLTSDQQIFGSGQNLFRLEVVDYRTTTNTSSNPDVVGQVIFPANEFSGSLTLRAILANTEVSGVAAIKLFNLDSLTYVDISGSGDELSVTGTQPTTVTSVDLFSATNFNTGSQVNYELHLYSSTGSNTAQVGGGELRPSGSFTGVTNITSSTTFISGTWVDGGDKLRTTASVAIDSNGGFADGAGTDVYFYVSGTFGSGSATDNIALFGGDVKISGTLAVGSGSSFIKDDRIIFTSASIRNVSGDLTFFDDNNLSGLTLTQLNSGGGGADADWTVSGSTLYTTSSVVISDAADIDEKGDGLVLYVSGYIDATSQSNNPRVLLNSDTYVSGFLISGKNHLYRDGARFLAMVGGEANAIGSGDSHVIIGGRSNEITRSFAGGIYNSSGSFLRGADNSSILGGFGNQLINKGSDPRLGANISFYSIIAGGLTNYIEGSTYSFIGGGNDNGIIPLNGTRSDDSAILAGARNRISGSSNSAIIAGFNNDIRQGNDGTGFGGAIIGAEGSLITSSTDSVIIGGFGSTMDEADYSAIVAGGNNNSLTVFQQSFIGGGNANTMNNTSGSVGNNGWSAIVGGFSNEIEGPTAFYNFIGAGAQHFIKNSVRAAIVGGFNSQIQGSDDTVIIGRDGTVTGSTNLSNNYILGNDNLIVGNNQNVLVGFNLTASNFDNQVLIGGGAGGGTVIISASNGVDVKEGSLNAYSGFSGSLTKLTDGSPYLIAGTNITLSTGSNGAVTINSTGGGGGGADTDWTLSGSTLYTTSSIVVGQQSNTDAIGQDVFFFVSGTFGSGSAGDTVSVFGGDVRISGTLAVGSGSTFIKENSITFTSSSIRNESGLITFYDDENLSGKTLTEVFAGNGYIFSNTNEVLEATGSITTTGSITAKAGFSGSLTTLTDGSPYLVAGNNITLSTGSSGAITINSTASGSGGGATSNVIFPQSGYSIPEIFLSGTTSSDLTLGSGDFTIGNTFAPTAEREITGVRFAWRSTSSIDVEASLWDSANKIASASISINSGTRIYEATFDTPVVVTKSLINSEMAVGVRISDGTQYSYISNGNLKTSLPNLPFIDFDKAIKWENISTFAAGDDRPDGDSATERYPVEPIITKRSQSIAGAAFTRLSLGSYTTSTATSSNPEAVGGGYFVPGEHNTTTNTFKAIINTSTGSNTAFVQLFNISSGSLVHIGGAGITELSSSNTTPTVVTSVNLFNATNFSTGSAIYETRVYGSGSSPIITIINSEMIAE